MDDRPEGRSAREGMEARVEATQERLPDADPFSPAHATARMPESEQRRSSCRSAVEKPGRGSWTCWAAEGMDARAEATQERLPYARQAPRRVAFSWLLLLATNREVTRPPQEVETRRANHTLKYRCGMGSTNQPGHPDAPAAATRYAPDTR